MRLAAEDNSRPLPISRPQPADSSPSTSDWSQADTVAPAAGGREEAFNMRVGIRMQLGLLVLWAVLIGLAVVTIATWVR
jgi:hypothetical protein